IFSTYPAMEALYDRFAHYFQIENHNLVMTAGADGAIRQVLETFCNPRDEVLTVVPTYEMYHKYAEILNCELNCVPHTTSFEMDLTQILSSITEKTKIILLASPNGSLGSHLEEAEI